MSLRSLASLLLLFNLTVQFAHAEDGPESLPAPPSAPPRALPAYPVPVEAPEAILVPAPPPEVVPCGPLNVTPTGVLASVEAGATFLRLPGRGGSPSLDLNTSPDVRLLLGLPFEWNDCPEMLLFGYRHLTSDGDTDLNCCAGMPPGHLHGELDLSQVDLDLYRRTLMPRGVTREYWLGVRFANFSLDRRAEAFGVTEHASSDFYGAGPHAGLGYTFPLGHRGLSLFAQGEIAWMYGGVRLRDEVEVPGTFLVTFSETHGRGMFNGGVRGGLDWRLPINREKGPQFHVSGGYQAEFWSHSAAHGYNSDDSNDVTDLVSHGPFLRLEVQY